MRHSKPRSACSSSLKSRAVREMSGDPCFVIAWVMRSAVSSISYLPNFMVMVIIVFCLWF